MSERARASEGVEADRSPEQEIHDVPVPRGGAFYDPRPLEDKARRRIAVALLVFALLAMVVFDIITVDEIKEFGVILSPLVALVAAATGFYYGTKG